LPNTILAVGLGKFKKMNYFIACQHDKPVCEQFRANTLAAGSV
jgi:hypothetical protein